MKYKETYSGSKDDFAAFIKKTVSDVFNGKLEVEGVKAKIPADYQLNYDVKYNEDENGGSINIKVAWDTTKDEEEEEVEF